MRKWTLSGTCRKLELKLSGEYGPHLLPGVHLVPGAFAEQSMNDLSSQAATDAVTQWLDDMTSDVLVSPET